VQPSGATVENPRLIRHATPLFSQQDSVGVPPRHKAGSPVGHVLGSSDEHAATMMVSSVLERAKSFRVMGWA
jgi:hypothetical protein